MRTPFNNSNYVLKHLEGKWGSKISLNVLTYSTKNAYKREVKNL